MAGYVVEVTDEAFEAEVLQSDKPVMVDFWAPWCGPCRTLAPRVDRVAEKLAAGLKVVKVNVDESPDTASSFGIRSIPTLIWFKGGEKVDSFIGVLEEEVLLSRCEALVKS